MSVPDTRRLKKMVIQRFLIVIVILAAMFFLPAWTFAYWEAWLYMAILIIPMFFVGSYLLKNDPDLLERRMRMREKRAEQKLIIQLSYPLFLLAYLLPGFDHRLGWSNVPPAVVIIANSLVFLGYGLVFWSSERTVMLPASSKWTRSRKSSAAGLTRSSATPCTWGPS
jgi:hypothetical protein